MNDRFKFRVWYKPYNGYVEKRDHLVLLSDGILCEYDGIEIDSDNYIIEQCTGLKDKNGNLIYEGDLIKVPPRVSDKIMRVVFNDYCFECFDKDTNEYILSLSIVNTIARSENIEIIGNIHENKC